MTTTVAVTGADGFIGSHLVEALVARGHHVRAMVQYNSFGTWGWLDTLSPDVLANVDVVSGDVTRQRHGPRPDRRRRTRLPPRRADRDPVLLPGAAVLRGHQRRSARSTCSRRSASQGSDRLVHTSTSETYGTARTVPITEDHPIQAQSPYAASKVGADKLVESYHASFEHARGDAAAVQHLRPAAVRPGGDPDRDQPGRRRRRARSGSASSTRPATSFRARHRRRVRRRRHRARPTR